jgi:hypothetical protein
MKIKHKIPTPQQKNAAQQDPTSAKILSDQYISVNSW